MSNLQVIENQSNPMLDLLSEVIPELRVNENGVGYGPIGAVARLCGVTQQTLSRHLSGHSMNRSKIAKALGQQGIDAHSISGFSTNGIPDKAIAVIIQYYAMDAGANCREEAKVILKAFLAVGIRTWMQQITGYQPPQPEPTPLPEPEEPKALPSDEVSELRGQIGLLRDEVRLLAEQHHDRNGLIEFLCGKYREMENKIAELETATPTVPTNNPAQLRTEIKEMVNAVAFEQDQDHRALWGKLYQAFQRTYGICPEPEAGESRIDAFARHDLIGPLHRVARLLFGYRAS